MYLPSRAEELCRACTMTNHAMRIMKVIGEEHYDNFTTFQNQDTSTEGFVASTDSYVILAFRGSQQKKDFITDAKFLLEPHHSTFGKVHSGFYHAWLSVRDAVTALLQQHDVGNKRLFVTGHSLGGGLAMMAALDVFPDEVYTFGAPRCFSSAMATHYDEFHGPCYRVVVAGDLITRLPKPVFYRHSHQLIYFNRFGRRQTGVSGWERFKDTIADWWQEIRDRTLFQWEDHAVSLYLTYVRRDE